MQVFKNGLHLFCIVEAIIDKKFEFRDNSGLFPDTATEFESDFGFVLLQAFKDFQRLGCLKNAQVNAGKSQIRSDFDTCQN